MAHNPPRPPGLNAAQTRQLADEIAKLPRTPWRDLAELADWIEDRVKKEKPVRLLPETAMIIAGVLRRANGKD